MDDDNMTRGGSARLAKAIENHWKVRGYKGILAWREEIPGMDDVYRVRSNIGPSGFPPRQHTLNGIGADSVPVC